MRRSRRAAVVAVVAAVVLAACDASSSLTPVPGPSDVPLPSESVVPPGQSQVEPSPTAASVAPTATPEPPLSLDRPEGSDPRIVTVGIEAAVPADDDGRIVVTVTSGADTRIDDLVLRWPSEVADHLFLAPFEPSGDRIRDQGPPLVQPWTKWVIGPGERGEPAGTISLGWGPLLPGATLTIPILVTRLAPGPIAFDLQVLAGNDLLTFDGGDPAELRVEVP